VRSWWATAQDVGGRVSHEEGWTLIATEQLQAIEEHARQLQDSLINAALSAQPVAWRYRWKNGGEWRYTDYPTDINTSPQYEAEALYARMPSSRKETNSG
jgi:hypothetical protein